MVELRPSGNPLRAQLLGVRSGCLGLLSMGETRAHAIQEALPGPSASLRVSLKAASVP